MANETRSVVSVEEPLPFSHTCVLKVTPRGLKAAKPAVSIFSSFFTGAGHKWRIMVYLGGSAESPGHVAMYLMHTPAAPGDAVEVDFNLAACGKSWSSAGSDFKEFNNDVRCRRGVAEES